jgi:outer membrane protein OmpA-like peptidoglycan-associated protein
MRKVLFCLALLFAASLQLQAQTDPNKNAFSAKVLFLDYGTPNDVEDQNITNGLELTYIRELLPWLNFAAPVKVGVIDVDNDLNNRTFFSIDGVLQLQYRKSDTAFITPYLMGGGGITLEEELGSNVQIPVGAGFNFKVGTRSYINLQGEYRISQEENRNNIQLGVGYLHKLGRMDADGDGVVDNLDKCPRDAGSPETDGCPDTDLDGVADIEDKCPARPGKKRFKGCPDTDDDGVMDDEDKCPEVAGLSSLMGCPDSDQDGITDADDDCPQVKGTASANGCPDRDGDGVGDARDRCPDDAGDMEGCPDTDGDGVHDGKDACINQAGTAENKGCPELNKEEQEVLSFAMRAVQFETGKARLKEESKEVLDQIVKIMQRYPGYALAINGHTDNVGDAENNKILSEDRARACYAYLVSEGISPKRISFQGFGEEQPIATNDTRSGRTLNRRVEFNLYIE